MRSTVSKFNFNKEGSHHMSRFAPLFFIMILASYQANAGTIDIGLISFDILNPSTSDSPQVDAFEITNFTGDPDSGGFDLPPDFPIETPLTFTLSTLTLVDSGGTHVIPLGDIGPGPLAPPDSLQFPDSDVFTSATFAATLDQVNLLFFDGSTGTALTAEVQATLFPSIGNSLVAGTDLVPLTVDIQNIPETDTFALGAMGLAAVLVWNRRKRRISQPVPRS